MSDEINKTETADSTQKELVSSEASGNEKSPPVADASSTSSPRRGLIAIAAETIAYIESAERNKAIQFRSKDKSSIVFLFLALLCAALFAFVLVLMPENRYLCVTLALVSDFLFGLAILWFVLLRFGILRTLEPRFALICWQLMLGAGVLFAFYTMNIAFFFFTVFRGLPGAGGD